VSNVAPVGLLPDQLKHVPELGQRRDEKVSMCLRIRKVALVAYGFLVSVAAVVAALFARITSERENQFSWMSDKLRRSVNYIHATVVDIFSALLLGLFFPINLEWLDPKEYDCRGGHPILFIHGFFGSSNNWVYHRYRLQKAGYSNIFTINLGHFQSMEQYAERVKEKVEKIEKMHKGAGVVLIGHSMGGLVAEKYKSVLGLSGDGWVRKIITVGSPLKGTKLAEIASKTSKVIGQMAPNSPCLIALEFGVGEDEKTEYCHVASTADNIIRPMSSAKGPQRNENITLNATGHVGYMFSSRVANLIIKKLQQLADHTQPV